MSDPKERLSLVTDFGTLKAGDLVVVNCRPCGGRHRGQLLGPSIQGAPFNGGWLEDMCFRVAPKTSHGVMLVGRQTVSARIVFLVDTGLSASETTETAKPRRLERVR